MIAVYVRVVSGLFEFGMWLTMAALLGGLVGYIAGKASKS